MKHLYVIYILIIFNSFTIYGQFPGSSIFNFDGIHDIQLIFPQPNFWDSLLFYKEEGEKTDEYHYMPATVIFNGQIIDSTGVRLKGNSSYYGPGKKKSIKLKFNKFVSGQKLDGLKKVNLNNNFNDPTLMREKLFLDVLRENGVYAPRCAYTRVYINDVYWGLYTMVDHIDKVFLKSYFYDKSGNLYKGDKFPWLTCANLSYHEDPIEYRECYTLETNEEQNDWSDLEDLITIINHTPLPDYFQSVKTVLNTESFINAWATNIVFVNVDSYVETGHNYYIYHNPITDKFEWITWDVNEAFGLWNVGMPLEQLYNLDIFYLPQNAQIERPLSFYMLEEQKFWKLYTDKVFQLVQTVFNPDILFPKIDKLYDLIKDDVLADTNKIISNQDFENNVTEDVLIPEYPGWVPGLKSFIQHRSDLLKTRLSELGYNFTDNSIPAIKDNEIAVILYPNPFRTSTTIKLILKSSEKITLTVYNSFGQEIEILADAHMQRGTHWIEYNAIWLTDGIYYCQLRTGSQIITSKMIVY